MGGIKEGLEEENLPFVLGCFIWHRHPSPSFFPPPGEFKFEVNRNLFFFLIGRFFLVYEMGLLSHVFRELF